jgi:pimeloyl-ACP methyl ester carboxylesterase
MSYAQSRGGRIWWEEEGEGEPLLMIMGLSFSLAMWRDLRAIMARHFRAILFDNRGVGKSDVPLRPWSMRTMARDAAAVMDAAGVQSAHVIGVSMGGMIAQELTLLYPSRVRKLVLACTQCGGPGAVRPDLEVYRTFARPFSSPERRSKAFVPLMYSPDTPAERIAQDRATLLANYAPLRGSICQIAAILSWKCYDRLPQIGSPTLVIHGDRDRLVPIENGRVIAGRIPRAKLVELPGAGHIFPTDQPERTVEALLEFLLDGRQETSPALDRQHVNLK